MGATATAKKWLVGLSQLKDARANRSIFEKIRAYKSHLQIEHQSEDFIIKTADSGAELLKALQLRHDIFVKEWQGVENPTGIDVDEYDFSADHLLIIDRKTSDVVGTYRLLCSKYTDRFYSQSEFIMTDFMMWPWTKLELGRACIKAEYRDGNTIDMLWKGLSRYIYYSGTKYLFGCSSLMKTEPELIGRFYKTLIHKENWKDDFRIRPNLKYELKGFDISLVKLNLKGATMAENSFDLLITGADLVLSSPKNPTSFKTERMDIGIQNGKIKHIGTLDKSQAEDVFDASGLTVLPGLIDTQVHFREPGLEHKETIELGSKSAAAGGITAFFEMPNTNPPTTSKAAFQKKLDIAAETSYTDFAFYAGAAHDNIGLLKELEQMPGCSGVKVFMGSSTGTLLIESDELLRKVLENTKRRIAVHAEDEPRLLQRRPIAENAAGDVSKHAEWRDAESALIATKRLHELAVELKHPVHLLHVSTKDEMEFLKENKSEYMTVEVTPQHLTLESPDCYLNLGTLAQMNPPIRSTEHRQAIWKALQSGVVDIIGSDHAPHTLEEKQKDYPNTPSGMPGVQTSLPVLLQHVSKGRLRLEDIVRFMCVNPVQIFSIAQRGFIAPDYEASFTIVDLKKEKVIEDDWIESRVGWTPFRDMKVKGWPVATMVRGQFAMQEGELNRISAQPLQFLDK
jgi:dihydroorotase